MSNRQITPGRSSAPPWDAAWKDWSQKQQFEGKCSPRQTQWGAQAPEQQVKEKLDSDTAQIL